MNRAGRVLVARTRVCRRELSTSSSVAVKEGAAAPAALPKAAPAPAAPPAAAKSKGGSTFFGRLSAFTAGSAVGLGAGYYYLNEVRTLKRSGTDMPEDWHVSLILSICHAFTTTGDQVFECSSAGCLPTAREACEVFREKYVVIHSHHLPQFWPYHAFQIRILFSRISSNAPCLAIHKLSATWLCPVNTAWKCIQSSYT
jgi:hypothetical protein